MVKLTLEQQTEYVCDFPEGLAPENGAWGRAGCTRFLLQEIDHAALREVLTLAWRNAVEKRGSRKESRRRPSKE
ncbi:MAG: hypothetical protein FJ295_06140 [Planctomycetes bacterium]|nr:hypothetical protein [Planctomycetota bacterium]